MRKILSFVFILSVCFSVLISCKSQEEEIQKPLANIGSDNKSITVAIYLKSDISYVNLFRTELDEKGELIDDGDKLNIAQFVPLDNSTPAISFNDSLIVSGKRYAYCLRYCTDGVYEYSGWSDWPSKIIDAEEDEKELLPALITDFSDGDLKYSVPDGCYFEFDEHHSWLTVKGGQIMLSDEVVKSGIFDNYVPCLVVSNGKRTCPFAIDSSLTPDVPIEEDKHIDLRDILTADFFDTDITVEGIILEKAEKKPDGKPFNQIQWSQLAEIEVKDLEGKMLDSIKISFGTTSDENHDFSGYERAATVDLVTELASDFSAY